MPAAQSSSTSEQPKASGGPDSANLDPREVERFQKLAADWWNPNSKFRPLHQIGPARLEFIRREMTAHFALKQTGLKPFDGLRVLDIGCGGGLVSEPMARLGARVTGLDPGDKNIRIAIGHSEPQGLDIDYRVAETGDLIRAGETFDAVLCLEVIEHVPDAGAFTKECAALVRPGGLLIMSTINRTLKSYALAIVGAEYVLGWLPRGTHQWDRFITLDEMRQFVMAAGLSEPKFEGMIYRILQDRWTLAPDTDVNYLAAAQKLA